MHDFACKISKILPRTPMAGEGDPLLAPTLKMAFGCAQGRKAPPAPQSQSAAHTTGIFAPPTLKYFPRH